MRTALILGLAASAALTVPAFAEKPDKPGTTKSTAGESQSFSCDGGTVSLNGSNVLWPPNHKMVTLTAIADTDEESSEMGMGETSITLTAASVEDVVGGDGNTETDSSGVTTGTDTDADDTEADGTASAPYQVRAERSGKGDGRTYTINWTATFDNGDSCGSADDAEDDLEPFTVSVPHDQGQGND